MRNMESSTVAIKNAYPDTKVLVGGAPITQQFCTRIGADFYSPNAHEAVDFLNRCLA
jgi:5-methyltetrahydrofolate--homocysteine methyltransferase